MIVLEMQCDAELYTVSSLFHPSVSVSHRERGVTSSHFSPRKGHEAFTPSFPIKEKCVSFV